MTDSIPDDLDWPTECGRVVFVGSQLPTLGGGYTAVRNLSAALCARGVAVTHVSVRPPSRSPSFPTVVVYPRWNLLRGPVVRGHGNPLRRLWALPLVLTKRIDRTICRRRFARTLADCSRQTLLVFTDIGAKVEADLAGFTRTKGGPMAVGEHHSSFESLGDMPWVEPAMRGHYGDVDAVVVLTAEDARGFASLVDVETVAIPNPVPPPATRATQEPAAVAVSLARYSPEKQLDLLVRCFAEATRSPDLRHWQLRLHGEGPERERIREEIIRAGVEDRVRLLGPTADVTGVLRGAAIHVLASTVEGTPVSAVEAAVSGVPTLAFVCSPGIAEVVTPLTGWPVTRDDPASYTATLREALLRPDELRRRGAAARDAAAVYHPDRVVSLWADLVRSLLVRRAA